MSSKVTITPYQHEHQLQIQLKPVFETEEDLPTRLKTLEANPNAHTVTLLGEEGVLAILGLIVYWPGVAEAWSLTSDAVKKVPVAFHKAVLLLLDSEIQRLKLHRVQMTVKKDFQEGMRWAEALGFFPEGILHRYGPDRSDFYLYTRLTT